MLNKERVRQYHLLKKPFLQHTAIGMLVLILSFSYFATHSLLFTHYRDVLNPNLWDVFFAVFKKAFVFFLIMGIPVYLNFLLVYKGYIRHFLPQNLGYQSIVKGWDFYLFLIGSLCTAGSFGLIYHGMPMFNFEFDFGRKWNWQAYSLVIVTLIFIIRGVSYSIESIERSRELERLKRREAENKLEFLKKQIRPHFLFNTMANLQALAIHKADDLPQKIQELSELLRYIIYDTNDRFVDLSKEIEFLKNYCSLQKLGLKSNVSFQLNIAEKTIQEQKIPPMLLLLVIENCFKHFDKSKTSTLPFIQIDILCSPDTLTLFTKNSFKTEALNEHQLKHEKTTSGLGQDSLVKKLKLYYGDNFKYQHVIDKDVYIVNLNLPLQ